MAKRRAKSTPPDPPQPAKPTAAERATAHRQAMARASRKQFADVAEVGPPPPPANKRRRNAAAKSLLKFLTTYFPHSTGKSPYGEDHKRMIRSLEHVIRRGGRKVNAMYRGFAKTTIGENAALWAVLCGHRRFVLLSAINKDAAVGSLDSIKMELAENDLLAEDFPEVCLYIAALDNKPQRARHQTCNGEHTHIVWRADTIVLPTIPGSMASGAILVVKPYAKSRGVKFKRPDGKQVRPDLFIGDDIQDDTSAATPRAVNKNLNILRKGILQSAGHQDGMAAVINGTIIQPRDMIDLLLEDPAWEGERIPMVKRWADAHETHWLGKYAELLRTFDRTVPGDKQRAREAATAYYRRHRKVMDAGCQISWEHCHRPDELSAIQHAYNIFLEDGEEVFASEYQQTPLEPGATGPLHLAAAEIAQKLSGLARGVVPKLCQWVTAYVDVHKRLLYSVTSAWEPQFGGGPIDYGSYPEQPTAYFAQATAPVAMEHVHPKMEEEAWLLAGLRVYVDQLLARSFRREDGATMRIGRLLVDAKWGERNELIKQFCRRHPAGGSIVFPAVGIGLGPTKKPLAEYKPEPGAINGLRWRLATQRSGDRVLSIDANWWKTLAAERLLMPLGTPGSWDLFQASAGAHALFCDHLESETPKTLLHKETGEERTVWEWKESRPDNHWWDCLVGSAVAGSMLGASPAGLEIAAAPRPHERPSLEELAKGRS